MSPTLETAHFLLRPPVMDDAGNIATYLNDFAVSGNLARVPFPYRRIDAEAWLKTRRPGLPPAETNFAIDLPGEGCVGVVGFHQGVNGTILGYWLARPFWGRGIMTEAAGAALDWLFEATDTQTVLSGVFHFNTASMKVQEKLGFTVTGRSSLLCLARGVEVEHIDTQLTRGAWKAGKR
ncbi:GNAT family N-acetyltransferase [Devosia nitrariae]|uniref:N-acetyltransferase n=1 Tax=Devosia nitrariae TaxID=2071872 RepID=A0ABQ5W375_9HYPH|nr:GNAT family N-acetyltransferase [Devosia nitrariae]GLQ54321.1 N-acetyltransferase [Devosia nitrariae]